MQEARRSKRTTVAVIGAGPAGLSLARTLDRDGFAVTCYDSHSEAGGVWSYDRRSPDLHSQAHGEHMRLVGLDWTHEERSGWRFDDSQVPSEKFGAFLNRYAETYLKGRIHFRSLVRQVRRNGEKPGWEVIVEREGVVTKEHFDKVALCTGQYWAPFIPQILRTIDQTGPLVFHSSRGGSVYHEGLKACSEGSDKYALVVGYGKSGIDAACYFARQGRKVALNFRRPKLVQALKKQVSEDVFYSRQLTYLFPARTHETWYEWFLHCTWLGIKRVKESFRKSYQSSMANAGLTADHPLHPKSEDAFFWELDIAGTVAVDRPGHFFDLVQDGSIRLIGPTEISTIVGKEITFSNGESLEADIVVAATGFEDSLSPLFEVREAYNLGITPRRASKNLPLLTDLYLKDAPAVRNDFPASLLYYGMIPTDARSFVERDLVIANTTTPNGIAATFEVNAHFISSWFLRDHFLKVPKTVYEAIQECEQENAFLRQRFPTVNFWRQGVPPHFVIPVAFARYVDHLLIKMSLPSYRGASGLFWRSGHWHQDQLINLKEERDELRSRYEKR